jgi:hypothetical protein
LQQARTGQHRFTLVYRSTFEFPLQPPWFILAVHVLRNRL